MPPERDPISRIEDKRPKRGYAAGSDSKLPPLRNGWEANCETESSLLMTT
jgi:hypothetical protein